MQRFSGYINTPEEFIDVLRTSFSSYGYSVLSQGTGYLVVENLKGKCISFESNSDDNITLNAFPSYDGGLTIDNQLNSLAKKLSDDGNSVTVPSLYFKNKKTYYDISINDNRIAGVYNIEGTWFSFYSGCFKPYSDLIDYPNPLFVGGNSCYDETVPANNLNTNNMVIGREGQGHGANGHRFVQGALNQNNQWVIFSDIKEDYTSVDYGLAIQPFYKNNSFDDLCPDIMETQKLFPIILQDVFNSFYLGELDDIYATSSYFGNNDNSIVETATGKYKLTYTTKNIRKKENGMIAIRVE